MNRTNRPPRRRAHLAALSVAALALTACGGDAEQSSPTPSESPAATPSASTTPSESPSSSPSSSQPHVDAGSGLQTVKIKGDSVTPVAQSVEVEVGETVSLQVTSDRGGELHVHATPEQYPQFVQGRSTIELEFDRPGAVDVEEHESGALVLRVLVQ